MKSFELKTTSGISCPSIVDNMTQIYESVGITFPVYLSTICGWKLKLIIIHP